MRISEIRSLAKFFDALGHERRIKIFLVMLDSSNKEIRLGDLAEELKLPQASLTHHIKMM